MTSRRRYTQRKRAESQEETRLRIVEATMQLHEEIGPRATTISAIAERAGVQRLTVYRHFPDETAVFQACTQHWLEQYPPPDPTDWADLEPGPARTRAALAAFYHYYRVTERMWAAAHRDASAVPALQGPMAEFRAHLRRVGDNLIEGFGASTDTRLAATLHHALAFTTWASLDTQGLDDGAMADLALVWVMALLSPE
ncbi:TetR/AcrR family transcriptional regulator [Halomonas kalidii]|uniref:Helix-turn-helix domain-containing protein n=1 Tax=Halomonas kalidii TaxID=3043293 RepID=A0ABT6VLB6_9GAMM|nr:TetR/AcrR family transcriptional regulator [Halomonas kalidii]MDI5934067.1 helix-turn-helix domain-containing protein [Halomonas kalidii]